MSQPDFSKLEWVTASPAHIEVAVDPQYDKLDAAVAKFITPNKMTLEGWTCLKYNNQKDNKAAFSCHADMKISNDHVGAALVYPPQKVTGGALVIYHDTKDKEQLQIRHVVEMSETKWLFVFIPLTVKHEVLTIKQGPRYCFLSPAYSETSFTKVIVDEI